MPRSLIGAQDMQPFWSISNGSKRQVKPHGPPGSFASFQSTCKLIFNTSATINSLSRYSYIDNQLNSLVPIQLYHHPSCIEKRPWSHSLNLALTSRPAKQKHLEYPYPHQGVTVSYSKRPLFFAPLFCNVSTSAGVFTISRHPPLPYSIWQLDTSCQHALYLFGQGC